ncbi:MAG: diadenylate cyclase [Pirellulaceae bacterium]|jgi:diadenylate cyclase
MKKQKFNKQFAALFGLAVELGEKGEADGLLVVLEGSTDWEKLKELAGEQKLLVAADTAEELEGAKEHGLHPIVLDMESSPVVDKLTQTLLESVAQEILPHGAEIVAVYSTFDPDKIDSISYIHLDEHLGRLTSRDLRQLGTSVPLDTLKVLVDLAIDIGREGREGKPVGTMFVIGDTRKVLTHCHPAGFDPVKGYQRKERDLSDGRVREAIKEVAMLDGATIVSSDGVVERCCQLVDASHAQITTSKGFGARHWAGAAISKVTNAIAIVVSESNGTVRLFQNGEVVLRIEPLRRAMKVKQIEHETPPQSD